MVDIFTYKFMKSKKCYFWALWTSRNAYELKNLITTAQYSIKKYNSKLFLY